MVSPLWVEVTVEAPSEDAARLAEGDRDGKDEVDEADAELGEEDELGAEVPSSIVYLHNMNQI